MDLEGLLAAPEPDFKALATAVDRHRSRLLSDWSYAVGTNNLGSIASQATLFAKILEFQDPDLNIQALALARPLFATENRKKPIDGVMKLLSAVKPKFTNAAFRLYLALATTAKGALVTDLYNALDLGSKTWQKLWATKGEVRDALFEFYLGFVAAVPPSVRQDVLSNKRFSGGWLTHLNENSTEQIEDTLAVLVRYVLNDEQHQTKHQRLGFFSDQTLASIASLLVRDDVSATATRFLERLYFDSKHGLAVKCTDWAKRPENAEPYNRLAFALLKRLRPWDNVSEQSFALLLLKRLPELAPPYYAHLAARYPFAPKLSMFWIGYSSFLAKCLLLPLELNANGMPLSALVESIIWPPMLQRNHVIAALQFKESPLVQFQAAQIIKHGLSRLEQCLGIYAANQWDPRSLYNAVISKIPEQRVWAVQVEQPLLQTALMACVRASCSLNSAAESAALSTSAPPVLPNALYAPLNAAEAVSGLMLAQAENLLEIQATAAARQKWWHPAPDQPHAFSTTLLKFACLNPQVADRCATLLANIASTTLVFADDDIAAVHPASVLVSTLESMWAELSSSDQEAVLKLIDESLARCIRSPYGYIDASVNIASGAITPLLMALLEQCAYSTSERAAKHFTQKYARNLRLAGEPINQSFTQEKLGASNDPDCVDFVSEAEAELVAKRNDLLYKIGTPLEAMAAVYRASTTPELAAHLFSAIPLGLSSVVCHPAAAKMVQQSYKSAFAWAEYVRQSDAHQSFTDKIIDVLDRSEFWQVNLEFLPESSLQGHLSAEKDQTLLGQLLIELTRRALSDGISVPTNLLCEQARLTPLGPSPTAAIIRAFANPQNGGDIQMAASTAEICAAAVISSKTWFPESKFARDPAVLLAAAETDLLAPEVIDDAISAALKGLGSSQSQQCIALLAKLQSSLPTAAREIIAEFASTSKSPLQPGFTLLFAPESDCWKRWLKHVVLALTKAIAEKVVFEAYAVFVDGFQMLLDSNAELCSSVVPRSSLNALIAASVACELAPRARSALLEIAGRLCYAAPAGSIDSAAHLQNLLTRPLQKDLPLAETLLIFRLFQQSLPSSCTPAIQTGLLCRWGGTRRASDGLVAHCLRRIEIETGRSWAEDVEWEFDEPDGDEIFDQPKQEECIESSQLIDYERPSLTPCFTIRRGKVVVQISRKRAYAVADHYDQLAGVIEPTEPSWALAIQAVRCYDVDHPCQGAYSDEFALGVSAACPTLRYSEVYLDARAMTETQLLGAAICATSSQSEHCRAAATQILRATHGGLKTNEATWPTKTATLLVVAKVLTFLSENDGKCPGHIAIATAHILRVILNPSHGLQEHARNWLLAGPSILPNAFPLYYEIASSEESQAPSEAAWLLGVLTASVAATDAQAVHLLTRCGAVQWAASFLTLPGRHLKLKSAAEKFIQAASAVQGGSSVLMRRAGLLGWPFKTEKIYEQLDVQEAREWAHLSKKTRIHA